MSSLETCSLVVCLNLSPIFAKKKPTQSLLGTGGPSLIFENKDALLTCVVSENEANNTVIWKKGDEILTAGTVRVTKDQRVRVLHDESK